MNDIPHWMQDHMEDDKRFQDESIDQFKAMDKKLNAIDKKLDPILEVYRAVLLSKGFVVGLSSVIVGITAIGAAIIWIVNHSISRP